MLDDDEKKPVRLDGSPEPEPEPATEPEPTITPADTVDGKPVCPSCRAVLTGDDDRSHYALHQEPDAKPDDEQKTEETKPFFDFDPFPEGLLNDGAQNDETQTPS